MSRVCQWGYGETLARFMTVENFKFCKKNCFVVYFKLFRLIDNDCCGNGYNAE